MSERAQLRWLTEEGRRLIRHGVVLLVAALLIVFC